MQTREPDDVHPFEVSQHTAGVAGRIPKPLQVKKVCIKYDVQSFDTAKLQECVNLEELTCYAVPMNLHVLYRTAHKLSKLCVADMPPGDLPGILHLTNMQALQCSTQVEAGGWHTENVKDFLLGLHRLSRLQNLQLEVRGGSVDFTAVMEERMVECHDLKKLRLKGFRIRTDLAGILAGCHQLRVLELASREDATEVKVLLSRTVRSVIQSKLQYLHLAGFEFGLRTDLKTLLLECMSLTKLVMAPIPATLNLCGCCDAGIDVLETKTFFNTGVHGWRAYKQWNSTACPEWGGYQITFERDTL
jgi:hypothetical protein